MQPRDFFPLGIAEGNAFCNRQSETAILLENIKSGKHSLLIATRRYGKSSLALHALKLSKLPYVETDFYLSRNEKIIEGYILNSIVDLIGKALGATEKLITSIKNYVKNLRPKLEIATVPFKLELTVDTKTDPATNVKEALSLLEYLLREKKQHAVLLMDEFQNVGVIAKGTGIEAATRNVAQKTQYLTFIFSGSNRKLLKSMFEDQNRPLYKLCWKITLARISSEYYFEHLQKAARLPWKIELNSIILDRIILLTEKHPYYLNKLCDRFWTFCPKRPPMLNKVDQAWKEILQEEKSDAIKEILFLSLGQKNVLVQIAKGATQLTGKQSMLDLEMTSSSILAALDGLEEKDMLEKQGDFYQIINPVVKYYVLSAI